MTEGDCPQCDGGKRALDRSGDCYCPQCGGTGKIMVRDAEDGPAIRPEAESDARVLVGCFLLASFIIFVAVCALKFLCKG